MQQISSHRLLWRTIPAALLALAMIATGAQAQIQTGNLYGAVSDEAGNRLPGATVTLSGSGAPRSQVTGANGEFRFPGLSPGSYSLRAELDGFSTFEYPNIAINIGRNTEVEVTMNSAVEDVITVTAESPLLDERRISTGATVTQTELESIPTARDPWAILQSTPGVLMDRINVGGNESGQQSQYVGPGSTGDQAVWSIDGMVITDMAATGSSPAYYDFDSFDEMQITTGGADATIATGGVVLNMVTKRGTNEWRGSGRYLLMDDGTQADLDFDAGELGQGGAWNATNRTRRLDGSVRDPGGAHPQAAFKQGNRINKIEDYGFEVGGPLVEDRLWLWGSYAKPQIDLLTVADVKDFTELETANLKLNAQVSPANSATLFAIQSDKIKLGRDAGPTRTQETTFNQSKYGPDPTAYKIEDTHVFSSNLYLTGLYSVVNGGFQLVPQGGLDVTPFLDDDSVWHNSFVQYLIERPQEQIKADASTFFNSGSVSHELKFGASYRTIEATTNSRWAGQGQHLSSTALFGTPQGFNLLLAARDAEKVVDQDYSGLYVQDTLSMGNLTANFAVRYDKQGGTNRGNSVPAARFQPLALPAQSTGSEDIGFEWESIVPRVGLTYALGPERKTLLRASYSQFADQLGTAVAAWRNPFAYPSYAYFINYNFEGDPVIPNSDFLDLNGDGTFNHNDVWFYSGNVNPNTGGLLQSNALDPSLDPQKTDELLLSIEHALLPEFVVGVNLTYRRITDILESELLVFDGDAYSATNLLHTGRRHRASDYVAVTSSSRNITVINPDGSQSVVAVPFLRPDGTPYSITTHRLRPELSTRNGGYLENGDREQEYRGLSLTFSKRLANRWMMRGSLSWSDWEWSKVPQSELEDPTRFLGSGSVEGDEVLQGSGTGSGAKGGIYINANWSYSFNALYQVAPDRPWGFNLAADLNGREGYPVAYFQRFTLPANHQSATVNVMPDEAGAFRYDDIHQVNARVEKEFSFNDFGVTLGIDGFNLLNDSSVLQRNNRFAQATSDHVREIVSPRVFRIGARLSFR